MKIPQLKLDRPLIIVRGAGDLATGIIYRLVHAGFGVVALEIENPSVIRRTVALAEVMTKGSTKVEDLKGELAGSVEKDLPEILIERVQNMLKAGRVPVVVDPEARIAHWGLGQVALVDAILAKRNLGTRLDMAPVVIAAGPGFTAGKEVHAVVETMRGHYLGRVIYQGAAIPNTGIPGEIAGKSLERLIKAPCDGVVKLAVQIGDRVSSGQTVMWVGATAVQSEIEGVVRGLIREGYPAHKGLKIGDVDPRAAVEHCYSISDKALSIGGGVLQAVLELTQLLTFK